MLSYYDGLVAQSRSMNEINRIHIAFSNTITPAELVELNDSLFVEGKHTAPLLRGDCQFTAGELRASARTWVEAMMDHLRHAGKPDPEPFGRKDIRKSVTLYSDGGPTEQKTLLITLPGSNFRLMMSIPQFLQHMDARTTDVLIIRDGTRSDYTAGLEGLAPSMAELGAGLQQLLDLGRYKRLAGIGVSAGGLPIILLATQLQFDAALSCGGGSPYDRKWDKSVVTPEEVLKRAAASGFNRRITVAYGAESPPDKKSAEDIAGCLMVQPVEVAVKDEKVEHNILYPLSRTGRLPAFLSEHLGLR